VQTTTSFNRPLHFWSAIPHYPAASGARDQAWHHSLQNDNNIATQSYTTASYPCPPPVRDQQGNVSNGLSRKQTAIRHNAHDAYYDRIHSTHNRVISKYGCLEKLQCKRESTHTPVDTPPPHSAPGRVSHQSNRLGWGDVPDPSPPPSPPTLSPLPLPNGPYMV
jgi:hypothetical protein